MNTLDLALASPFTSINGRGPDPRTVAGIMLACVLAALLLMTGSAHAAGLPSSPEAKSGRFMFNLKLGPGFAVYDDVYAGVTPTPQQSAACTVPPYTCPDTPGLGVTGTIMFDFGIALTADRNLYLTIPIQFQVAKPGSFVLIPIGAQYDIPLPVKGLYLTPRFSGGYAAYVVRGHRVADLGVIIPEFGAKYVFLKRGNVGLDLFSLPIYFGDFTAVSYRVLVYGGVNF
jgi:hypothetical protein